MYLRTFLPLILALGACRAGSVIHGAPSRQVLPRAEVWVDVARGRAGDGSRERPLRSLAEALAQPGPLTVHVGPGLYEGPFTLPEGVRLEGVGPASVLYAKGGDSPVLRAGGAATLVGVVVQGGRWGLDVAGGGPVRLKRVVFSGQRTGAVRVRLGRLEAEATRFEASVSETVGVLVEGLPVRNEAGPGSPEGGGPGRPPEGSAELDASRPAPAGGVGPAISEAHLRDCAFVGPYRRAVRVQGAGARAVLEDASFSGPVTAVGVDIGHAEVRRAHAEGGRGAAFSVAEGSLVLRDVRVTGHEYGLSAIRARLDVRGFTSVRAERAGLGIARSRGTLEDVLVWGSGNYGALQFTGAELGVRRFRVDGASEYGLVAVGGALRLRDGVIVRVRSKEGDTGEGLHLRQVRADVEGLVVRDTAGACVLAAQNARVVLRDAELTECRHAGLAADTLGRLEATGVEIRGSSGPALAVFNDGNLRVDALTVSGAAEGLVWAECQGDTRVHLGRVRSEDSRGLSAPCVEQDTSTPPASPVR